MGTWSTHVTSLVLLPLFSPAQERALLLLVVIPSDNLNRLLCTPDGNEPWCLKKAPERIPKKASSKKIHRGPVRDHFVGLRTFMFLRLNRNPSRLFSLSFSHDPFPCPLNEVIQEKTKKAKQEVSTNTLSTYFFQKRCPLCF